MSEKKNGAAEETGLFDWLWNFFGDLKVAIVLLIIVALVSVAGTLIQQKASEGEYVRYYGIRIYSLVTSTFLERFFDIDYDADPEEYVSRFGTRAYGALKALGLTNVYGSWWFLTLLTLLGFSIVVCSTNRFRTLVGARGFRVKELAPGSVARMPLHVRVETGGTVEDALEMARGALASAGYRLRRGAESGDGFSFTAERGTVRNWGSFITHVSILVIYIGAVIGVYGGYEEFAVIREGESYYEKKGGFWVRLNDFSMELDERLRPLEYRSDLSVFEGGKEVARKTIEVNHPLVRRGIYFYQSSYGLVAAEMIVESPGGGRESIWIQPEEPVIPAPGLPTLFFERNEVFPDEKNPSIFFLYETQDGSMKRFGWLTGKPQEVSGYRLSLGTMRMYTGLNVKKDPGVPIVWLGCALIVAGLFITFYVTHRRLFGVAVRGVDGKTTVTIGGRGGAGDEGFGESFKRVAEAVRGAGKNKKSQP